MNKFEECIKINNWYYPGIFQIGGNTSMFYDIGWDRIKELYNINYE